VPVTDSGSLRAGTYSEIHQTGSPDTRVHKGKKKVGWDLQ
jgi:hypothetical protein